MGVGFFTKANVPVRGLLKRRVGRDELFAQIRKAVESFARDPLLAGFLDIGVHEHWLGVVLHPAAEPLEFLWEPLGTISASLKTSTVGPGFHAYAVDLMDAVAEHCKLNWQWAEDEETDYAISRDYSCLQAEMQSFLRRLARGVLENCQQEYADIAINWPLNSTYPVQAGFAVTPLGPQNRSWWQRVAETDDAAELAGYAASFFPWWEQGMQSEFWRKTGLVFLWSAVPWHPPQDERERRLCHLALDCLDRAKQLDPGAQLPVREIAELRQLVEMSPDQATTPPRTDGIGYRRNLMVQKGTGPWTVTLPGYFYEQVAEDGTNVDFWFGDRAVYISSISISSKGEPASPQELVTRLPQPPATAAEKVEFSELHLAGRAMISRVQETGQECWQLQGAVAAKNTVCIVSIRYQEPCHREWAVSTFRSIRHPLPENETA